MDIDFLAGAGAEQVLLRLAHFFAAENAHRALRDVERAIGNRAIEIDRDRAAEAATLRDTRLSGLLKLKRPGVGGRISRSQCAQCQPVENGCSAAGFVSRSTKLIWSFPKRSAVSIDSTSRCGRSLGNRQMRSWITCTRAPSRLSLRSVSARTISPFSQTRR